MFPFSVIPSNDGLKNSDFVTKTVTGFGDFTTTVGSTVMVFTRDPDFGVVKAGGVGAGGGDGDRPVFGPQMRGVTGRSFLYGFGTFVMQVIQ